MSRMDTTTDVDTRPSKKQFGAGRSRSTNCRCGQQLDVCAREHCPRCGRTLRRR